MAVMAGTLTRQLFQSVGKSASCEQFHVMNPSAPVKSTTVPEASEAWSRQPCSTSSDALCSSFRGRALERKNLQPAGTMTPKRSRGHAFKVVCMANPRRVQMVAQQINRELSDMLIHDKVLKEALTPESALGSDLYLSSVATISEVEVSADLQVAKVFISVFGDQRGRDIAMDGLRAKQGYVRAGLGKRMKLRMTPEVRFIEDDSLERGSRVLAIINKLKDEREKREAGEVVLHNAGANDDDLDDDSDDVTRTRQERRTKPEKARSVSPRSKDRDDEWGKKDKVLSADDFRDLDFGDDENIIFVK